MYNVGQCHVISCDVHVHYPTMSSLIYRWINNDKDTLKQGYLNNNDRDTLKQGHVDRDTFNQGYLESFTYKDWVLFLKVVFPDFVVKGTGWNFWVSAGHWAVWLKKTQTHCNLVYSKTSEQEEEE